LQNPFCDFWVSESNTHLEGSGEPRSRTYKRSNLNSKCSDFIWDADNYRFYRIISINPEDLS